MAAGRESDARTEWCRSAEPGGREEGGRSHAGGAVMADRVVAVRREPDGWAWWAGRRGRAVGELQTGCRAAEYGGCRPGGERSGGARAGGKASAWGSRCERTVNPIGTGIRRGAGASRCGGSLQSRGGVLMGS